MNTKGALSVRLSILITVLVVVLIGAIVFFNWHSRYYETIQQMSTATSTPTPSRQNAPLYTVYAIANPDGLLLTDSSGRRTGEYPRTGTIYQEIPNTTYMPQPRSIQLTFSQPPAGQYTIQVIGKHAGQYSLWTGLYSGPQWIPVPTETGSIQPGQVITYTQNYVPDNLASSTLMLVSTSSSPSKPTTPTHTTTTAAFLPSCTFSADPTQIVQPQTSSLAWSCQHASICQIVSDHGDQFLNQSPSGTLTVTPIQSTDYTLNCTGTNGGVASSSVEVAIPPGGWDAYPCPGSPSTTCYGIE